MNVSLNPIIEDYIKAQISGGKYNNASEVIREAIRLKMQQDEIYQVKLEALRSAIIVGDESGEARSWNMDDFLLKMDNKIDGE